MAIIAFVFPLVIGTACDNEGPLPATNAQDIVDENDDHMKDTITIHVGDKVFSATLLDNAAATALKAMLPFTINMTELNGNEKFFRLPGNLPTSASNPTTINSGDLMLWGSNTLVLFYETFSTSYSYTKLGRIDSPTGLAAALGTGNVTVTIDFQ
ncbi:hypothetical protein JI741_24770 [Chryseolinea sp. Jin1]|uniref:Cyclophilin-like domain-containing protein n=2 Tax=Chryseolinea lacunae TaxID=2801331 RepID=A0ABS1KYR0_9BACT|nr:hypothetical protein [Chryseolinea lacunae]